MADFVRRSTAVFLPPEMEKVRQRIAADSDEDVKASDILVEALVRHAIAHGGDELDWVGHDRLELLYKGYDEVLVPSGRRMVAVYAMVPIMGLEWYAKTYPWGGKPEAYRVAMIELLEYIGIRVVGAGVRIIKK